MNTDLESTEGNREGARTTERAQMANEETRVSLGSLRYPPEEEVDREPRDDGIKRFMLGAVGLMSVFGVVFALTVGSYGFAVGFAIGAGGFFWVAYRGRKPVVKKTARAVEDVVDFMG